MENMVKMIAAHTSNLLEFASVQSTLNDCIIKKIGSITFFIGCIIGYLIVTRKK